MSFRTVELPTVSSKRDTHASISIGGQHGLCIGFGCNLASTLKLKPGSYGLQIGEGDNAGLIRLVPAPSGRKLRFSKKGGATISCGHLPEFAKFGKRDKAWCVIVPVAGHEVGALQITLPAWRPGESDADADDGAGARFGFLLDDDRAETLRDMATEADQEVPDYLADLVATYIDEYRKETGAED